MQATMALAAALLVTGQISDRAPLSGNTTELKHCVISLIEHVQVPAEEAGVIVPLTLNAFVGYRVDGFVARTDRNGDRLIQETEVTANWAMIATADANQDQGVSADELKERIIADIADKPSKSPELQKVLEEIQLEYEAYSIIKEGMHVQLGQPLAKLDDTEAQKRLEAADLEYTVARMQADTDVNVKAATAAQLVAEAEVAESEEINRRSPGSVPNTQLRRERLTAERAALQVAVAKDEQAIAKEQAKVKEVQVRAVKAEIKRRKIDAPLGGVVVQVFKHVGEWCTPGDPIMRVVRMDRLRVEGFVDANRYSPQNIQGQPVQIFVSLPDGEVKVDATINYCSQLVEASGEFRVWAEVDNQKLDESNWLLRPGLKARMVITVNPKPTNLLSRSPATP